jgi:hypothetical protein
MISSHTGSSALPGQWRHRLCEVFDEVPDAFQARLMHIE